MKKLSRVNYVIGIDEVGRGALAGPVVVVAAMVLCKPSKIKCPAAGTLKDSKKLSAKKRELWFDYFAGNPDIIFAIGWASEQEIEKLNISQAANLAAFKAFTKLSHVKGGKLRFSASSDCSIYLDGGLYLKNKTWQARDYPQATTSPKADERIPAVSVASIIAKVYRDALMVALAKKFPGYGFEAHKGYGTRGHYEALRKKGASSAHRLTFLHKGHRMKQIKHRASAR